MMRSSASFTVLVWLLLWQCRNFSITTMALGWGAQLQQEQEARRLATGVSELENVELAPPRSLQSLSHFIRTKHRKASQLVSSTSDDIVVEAWKCNEQDPAKIHLCDHSSTSSMTTTAAASSSFTVPQDKEQAEAVVVPPLPHEETAQEEQENQVMPLLVM